jgi:dTDP-4-dehydrorhamnose 3,5-epimerase
VNVVPTSLPGVILLEPRVFSDERGHFFESYNRRALQDLAGIDAEFVQDNHSCSARGVVRGLHYQIQQPQGKLVRVIAGSVYDVAVDIRRSSPNFGRWFGCELTAQNKRMLWIPPGFAHGFIALEARTEFLYKVTDFWAAAHERTILWDDTAIGIRWPDVGTPIVSAKDREGRSLATADVFP